MEVKAILEALECQLEKSEAIYREMLDKGDRFDRGWWHGNCVALRVTIDMIRRDMK